jgi:hypothetical protein
VTVSEKVTLGFLDTIGSISFVSEGLELDECSPLLHSEHDDLEQWDVAAKKKLKLFQLVSTMVKCNNIIASVKSSKLLLDLT